MMRVCEEGRDGRGGLSHPRGLISSAFYTRPMHGSSLRGAMNTMYARARGRCRVWHPGWAGMNFVQLQNSGAGHVVHRV